MKPKFLISLLITLILGGSIGYMLGSGAKENTVVTSGEEGVSSRKAPRFGDGAKTPAPGNAKSNDLVYSNKTSIDALLLKYSRMTPEQIQAEIKSLSDTAVLSQNPDVKKLMSLVYLSYKWGQTAPQQALLESESLGIAGMLAVPMIFQGWAEANPEAAASYYGENKKRIPENRFVLNMVASEMGKSSPDAAMAWLGTLSEKEKSRAMGSVIGGIAEAHPEQLKANISKLSPEDLKDQATVSGIAEKWGATNWGETNEWIKSLPEEQQASARAKAISGLAKTDLDKATTEFKSLPESEQANAARGIVVGLTSKGGTEALEWVVNNTTDTMGEKLASSAIGYGSSYTQKEEMKEYISALPDGPVRDSSLENVIQKSVYTFDEGSADYKSNVELAGTITDEKKRNNATSTPRPGAA